MTQTVKIAVVGASGRMGRALISAVSQNPKTMLVGALEREGADAIGVDAHTLIGEAANQVEITADKDQALGNANVIIDFTAPTATLAFADYAAQKGIAHIVGTTGMSTDDDTKLAAFAEKTTIMKSGNMSMGVIMLSVLVERAAKALAAQDWDIEVLEMHHKHKVDAPSGTALLLGEAAATGREIDLADKSVRVRDGHTGAREEGSVGFATLRGGSVVGDHSVLFAGNGESITLSHRAEDRGIFARGAVNAAIWSVSQKPGLYSMRDVLGLND